jgi:hypothetical protein
MHFVELLTGLQLLSWFIIETYQKIVNAQTNQRTLKNKKTRDAEGR